MVGLITLLFVSKATGNQGQGILAGFSVKSYIEKAKFSVPVYSKNQLADINSISCFSGQGGLSSENQESLETTQSNSLISLNSVLTDLPTNARSQVISYTVQEGDLLSFIAQDFGVSMNSIIWANNLKNADAISPGQELKIPPVSGVIHVVKSGETVASIAKKYNAKSDKILEFNGLSEDCALQINQELVIPDGQIIVPKVYATNTIARFSYLPNLYDYFIAPTTGYNWGKAHGRNAVDVANSCGTPIYASAQGTVASTASSGWNGGAGKYVKIFHPNGTETLYAHLSKVIAKTGEYVSKGELIGLMGSTGNSTGCHLHFEVHGAKNPLLKY